MKGEGQDTGRRAPGASRLSVIAAVARNGVIGRDNTLPWRLPEDLKRFRALTMGHHIVMGRRTWESIGRLLPGRSMIIVTRNPEYTVPGCAVTHSLAEAVALAGDDPEVFVIGGAELYREALATAERLYLTEIRADFEGDAWFPEFDPDAWIEVSRDSGNDPATPHDFVVYERK
ncbi:MAG TPA: dihydrofolate reductase [Burkholderiales bacterium]